VTTYLIIRLLVGAALLAVLAATYLKQPTERRPTTDALTVRSV